MAITKLEFENVGVTLEASPVLHDTYGLRVEVDGKVKDDRIVKGDRGIVTAYVASRMERWIELPAIEVLEMAERLVTYVHLDLPQWDVLFDEMMEDFIALMMMDDED